MSAIRQDFDHDAGQKHTLTFTVKDGDGQVQNITGFSAWFTLHQRPGSTPLLTKSVGSGIVLTGLEGLVTVTLADSDTVGFNGAYFYELWLKDSAEDEAPVAFGHVYVRPFAHTST